MVPAKVHKDFPEQLPICSVVVLVYGYLKYRTANDDAPDLDYDHLLCMQAPSVSSPNSPHYCGSALRRTAEP